MATAVILCNTTPAMRERVSEAFDVENLFERADAADWIATHGDKVDYVLTDGPTGVATDWLAQLPALKAISCYSVGYDNVDAGRAAERGIPVSHTPGVLDDEVSTTAILLYLTCFRNFEAQMSHTRAGKWESKGALPLARTADGKTVGILGLGRIGKATAKKLEAFGATILYSGRTKQDVAYEFVPDVIDMARRVDALISILPATPATRHILNRDVFDALGPEGVLVNVGRGSSQDETALIAALAEGRLGWAGLDVFEDEPHVPEALRALPNVVMVPHVGSATEETRAAMGNLAIDNLIHHRDNGRLLTPVPESAGIP